MWDFFFFGWVFVMPTLLVMPEIIEKILMIICMR